MFSEACTERRHFWGSLSPGLEDFGLWRLNMVNSQPGRYAYQQFAGRWWFLNACCYRPMNIPALQIKKHLDGNGLAPVYVLCGEDEALISATLSALKQMNESGDMPGSMAVEFDSVDDHRCIFDELYTRPFLGMAGKRMVVVRSGTDLVDSAPEQLAEYAAAPSSTSVLVLCCEKLDRRRNPGRKLAASAVCVDCSKVRWSDARRWLREEAARHGRKLDSAAGYALVQAVGPNMSVLKRELEKLILYAGDGKVIDQRAVDDIVPESRSRTVYDLSDAIARSAHGEAIALGETLLLHGESPEMVIAFLGVRMRELWQMARLARRSTPARQIASEVGVPEFAVKRALGSVRDHPDRWFADRLNILTEADSELKTSSLPSRLRTIWLTNVVSRLCGTRWKR